MAGLAWTQVGSRPCILRTGGIWQNYHVPRERKRSETLPACSCWPCTRRPCAAQQQPQRQKPVEETEPNASPPPHHMTAAELGAAAFKPSLAHTPCSATHSPRHPERSEGEGSRCRRQPPSRDLFVQSLRFRLRIRPLALKIWRQSPNHSASVLPTDSPLQLPTSSPNS